MFTKAVTTITVLSGMLSLSILSACDAEDDFELDEDAELDDEKSLANWVDCAQEGKSCYIHDKGRVVMRWGVETEDKTYYRYAGLNGIYDFPCKNQTLGVPIDGHSNRCSFSKDLVPQLLDDSSSWQKCVRQGEYCDAGSDARWVRYGYGDQWIEFVRSGRFRCDEGSIGFDPKEGEKNKECQLGAKIAANTPGVTKPATAVPSNDSDWIHCAVHGQQCNMDDIGLGAALLAYGNGTDWTTLITSAPSAYCHNGQIGFDPKEGVGKDCYYRRLPSTAKTTGRWIERIAHGSPSGGEVSFGVQHGLEVSEGRSSTTTWSTEFSYSQTTGIGLQVAGTGGETQTTYSATFGLEHSTEISTAVSKSTIETADVSCAVPENSAVKLYQFATDTEVQCIDAGDCKATAYLLMSQCIVNPPADYTGPQCFPGECDPNDPLCLTCV
jgi:CEL-III C-terminal